VFAFDHEQLNKYSGFLVLFCDLEVINIFIGRILFALQCCIYLAVIEISQTHKKLYTRRTQGHNEPNSLTSGSYMDAYEASIVTNWFWDTLHFLNLFVSDLKIGDNIDPPRAFYKVLSPASLNNVKV